MDRSSIIIRTSVVGIAVNVVLVLFKMAVGFASNSIAIILDAVNNLSDALSSVITIAGTKLAGRAPDKKHPYGYGRIEYLTGALIAAIVLSAGITSFKESVTQVLHPEEASYSTVTLVVVAAAVVAKLLCGRYVRGVGEKVASQSLIASGSDALFDAILSLSTLAAGLASRLWGWQLEGPLGVVISIFILKAGIEMLRENLDTIIGTRTEQDLSAAIRETVCAFPEVRGAYDLSLHSYGPSLTIGSVHIEVADETTARELHRLTRSISAEAYAKHGIILTVGIYAANNLSLAGAALKEQAEALVQGYPEILQLHGFYADEERKRVMFDLVVDFKADAPAVRDQVRARLEKENPGWTFDIVLDSDFSD